VFHHWKKLILPLKLGMHRAFSAVSKVQQGSEWIALGCFFCASFSQGLADSGDF
jgi:hypothetical protein